jgi:hypothetical protein
VSMTAQWQGLLKNLGIWQGSFTQFSSAGELLQDTPSELALSLSEDEKTVYLSLKREASAEVALQFNYPGPGPQIPFFETGCFSQGSLQWSPYSQFGAEFGLIEGDRRLRLVQLYPAGTEVGNLTLIRESRAGSGALESPPLQIYHLSGRWEGEAITLYPDGRTPNIARTYLQIRQEGDRLHQSLQFGPHTLQSCARIDGSLLHFEEGSQPMQLVCLPGGASSLGPIQIQRQMPFVTEVGWLIRAGLRKRLVREYSDRGEWVSITLITEHKIIG